ncbi:hypothetical protein BTVI_80999 [Pitangus sulphuratus]|nr:hypothetical protein BTVI_80999 [Pitangus sulphuratus]
MFRPEVFVGARTTRKKVNLDNAEEPSDSMALVGTWCPAKANPPHKLRRKKNMDYKYDGSDIPLERQTFYMKITE